VFVNFFFLLSDMAGRRGRKGIRQPFHEQKGGQMKDSLAQAKKNLTRVVGGKEGVPTLLTALRASKWWKDYTSGVVQDPENKLKLIVAIIKKQYDRASNVQKRQWSSMVCDALTRSELAALGWDISAQVCQSTLFPDFRVAM
jgi:hypothetical protein